MSPIRDEWRSDDGGVRLILGDCLEVLPTLSGIDAVVADPPYGINLKEKTSQYSTVHKSGLVYADSRQDAMVGPKAVAISMEVVGRIIATVGTKMLFDYPRPTSIGTIFSPGNGGMDSWGFGCNQPILYYGKCPYLSRGLGSRPNSFASNRADPYEKGEKNIDHPCPKPLLWMAWLVERGTVEPGEMVCDPFMGSGTTGVACIRTGRRFVGIEIEPKYFEIAVQRCKSALREDRSSFQIRPKPRTEPAGFFERKK